MTIQTAPLSALEPETIEPLEQQVEALQREIELLRQEISVQRQRDRALNVYMTRLDEEMRLAARLQQDFLPRQLPEVGRVRFHAMFRPAGYVSGDLYDVMRLDETHVGFYMADAVGHGMPAALLTMFLKRALQTKQITDDGYRLLNPAEAVAHLNTALVEQELSHATFATAIYGTVDTATGTITFARGGHPNPILLPRGGPPRPLEVDGSLLGVFPGEQYASASAQLEPGDRLVVYSDGIEVAFSTDRTLNTEQWRQELAQRCHLPPQEMIADLARQLDSESGSLEPRDDLTLIIMEMVE